MTQDIFIEPLSAEAFAPFGDIIDASAEQCIMINRGKCGRYNDLARLEFKDPGGRAAISIFEGTAYELPLKLDMVERHPLGSQAFLPMSAEPFLVIVAPDDDGRPGRPRAFWTNPHQGVNYHCNIWHGVLTPIGKDQYFSVVDRVGDGNNLEEFWFSEPYFVKFRP